MPVRFVAGFRIRFTGSPSGRGCSPARNGRGSRRWRPRTGPKRRRPSPSAARSWPARAGTGRLSTTWPDPLVIDPAAIAGRLAAVTTQAERLVTLGGEALLGKPAMEPCAAALRLAEYLLAVLTAVAVYVVDDQVLGRAAALAGPAVMVEDGHPDLTSRPPGVFALALAS